MTHRHLGRIGIFLVIALLGTYVETGATRARERDLGLVLAPGDRAPRLTAPALEGHAFVVEWNKHALTLVNFWATRNEPCQEQMPMLQDLYARRSGDGLAVYGVLYDIASNADALELAGKLGVKYPLMRGNVVVTDQWGGIGVLPTSYLVTRDGKIARRYVGGAKETTQSLVRDAEALLGGRPLGTLELPTEPETAPRP